MISDNDILKEVQEQIQDLLERGQVVRSAWITNAVVHCHPDITGSDSDFYTVCAYGHVKNKVREALRKYKDTEEEKSDPQITLPGFERLQRGYLVNRTMFDESESVLVPINQLSAEEIREKAQEYQRMGKGCFIHASELLRYLDIREANPTQQAV